MTISTLLVAETANIPWWFWGLLVGFLGLLLTIIGFLVRFILSEIKEKDSDQKKKNEMFFSLFSKVNETITSLDKTLSGIQQHNLDFEKRYDEHQDICKFKYEPKK